MQDATAFLPRIPQPGPKLTPVTPPFTIDLTAGQKEEKKKLITAQEGVDRKEKAQDKQETLFSWMKGSTIQGIKALPKMWVTLGIQLGVVIAVNLIFWQIKTWTLPSGIASIVSLIVFLTATYNNIIPKTIYWVIFFTFGKRLLKKIRKEGLAPALSPVKAIVPEFKKAYKALDQLSWTLLSLGGGIGLIVANNFASYSRFSGARNKMDKYFIALVISFTVSYILGESRNHGIFKFLRLSMQDIGRLMKKQLSYSDQHSYILLSGFVLGLLLDAPIILMKIMYGGYLLGVLCVLAAFTLLFIQKARAKQ